MADDLRARTRRAVRAELAETAQQLFGDLGFDATTMDQVASAAGMSRRSVNRYFSSKEDLVVGKYELWVEDTVEALRARPADEPDWTALRRTFDRITDYYADPVRRAAVLSLQEVVDASPTLRGTMLEVFDRLQAGLAQVLTERGTEPVLARALTGSAWACLQAALGAAMAADPDTLAERLDAVMTEVGPRP